MFDRILPYVLAGISVGGQYALIAVGYTMVYGILRLINFAHGDIFKAAGFFMVYLTASLPMGLSIPLVIILTIVLGFTLERVAYKPLRNAPRMSVMISAIGASYLLQNLMWYVTGGLAKQYPVLPWLSNNVQIFSASTKIVTIVTPILTIGLVFALVALIRYTKIGMAMRAVSHDFETSQLMGIRINSVISMTFVIGSGLAAVGSMLYFTNYSTVTPTVGAMPGLKAFVAAVFGGIGSIPGAVIGAFIIGICENLIKAAGYTAFSDAFTFALLIVVLLFKPTGLHGAGAQNVRPIGEEFACPVSKHHPNCSEPTAAASSAMMRGSFDAPQSRFSERITTPASFAVASQGFTASALTRMKRSRSSMISPFSRQIGCSTIKPAPSAPAVSIERAVSLPSVSPGAWECV